MEVYFTGKRGTFKVRRADGMQAGENKGKLIHLFDQARQGPGQMVSHFLLVQESELPILVHQTTEGLLVEGFFSRPKDMRQFAARMKQLGHEIYHGDANRTCPHCFSTAKPKSCRKCLLNMCEECISDHPNVGPVCGLCLTEIERQEKRKRREEDDD